MNLSTLLSGITPEICNVDCLVQGIALDSRLVKSGYLFLACCGDKTDGRLHIQDAIDNGAIAVLCENPVPEFTKVPDSSSDAKRIPIFGVIQLKEKVGLIAATFYDDPTAELEIIGVTGTNGKTSCTHFIANSLNECGFKCGVIGTLGVGIPPALQTTINTTPDPISLQRELANFKFQGVKAVAMEVSSHSLVQQRVAGINFNIAVFTNLTHEHLDYHGDMENYGWAKKMLFMRPELQYAVINVDDAFGRSLLREIPPHVKTYAFTMQNTEVADVPTVRAIDVQPHADGINAKIISPWGTGMLHSGLLGKFNLSNLLAVFTVLQIMGIDMQVALNSCGLLQNVTGRMHRFKGNAGRPLVVVDYAHTPDALQQALLALREHCSGALWCVFGCGGDRDRSKRSVMGQIAERYSDHIVLTNDNPRMEDPQQIIADIMQGLLCPWAAEVEQDREVAIAHAVDCAGANDIVLVAGKGHEDYQIIGNEKLVISDINAVKTILSIV